MTEFEMFRQFIRLLSKMSEEQTRVLAKGRQKC
jgi:hypothetical protein